MVHMQLPLASHSNQLLGETTARLLLSPRPSQTSQTILPPSPSFSAVTERTQLKSTPKYLDTKLAPEQHLTWTAWAIKRRSIFNFSAVPLNNKNDDDSSETREATGTDNPILSSPAKAKPVKPLFIPSIEDENKLKAQSLRQPLMGDRMWEEWKRLSEWEWRLLLDFWEHAVFRRARLVGVLLGVLATLIICYTAASDRWFTKSAENSTGVMHQGLWFNCSTASLSSSQQQATVSESCSSLKPHKWRTTVIGLLLAAAIVSCLSLCLSVLGICNSRLPARLYYFHSAAEVFFVCGLASAAAMLVYTAAYQVWWRVANSRLQYGYFIGWIATGLYLLAALCLNLDVFTLHVSGLITKAQKRCCLPQNSHKRLPVDV